LERKSNLGKKHRKQNQSLANGVQKMVNEDVGCRGWVFWVGRML